MSGDTPLELILQNILQRNGDIMQESGHCHHQGLKELVLEVNHD